MPTLLIIGAGPGIGQATARRFGREGWRVVLAARNEGKLRELASDLADRGVDASVATVDAGDPAAVAELIEEVAASDGGLDTVHYNAAVLRSAPFFDITDEEIAEALAVNIGGALAAIRAARRVFGGRGGTVLLTGGGLALHPSADAVTLGLGKAGIRHMAEALHASLANIGIHLATVTVNVAVDPGSAKADGVADRFWSLQTQEPAAWTWEGSYSGA